MSRRLVGPSLGLAALGLVLATALGRELEHSRPLPGPLHMPPTASAATTQGTEAPVQRLPVAPAVGDASASGRSSANEPIASGELLDPSGSSAGAAAEPTGPPPLLYGVVAGDGVKGRAYVEDPLSKMVRGYQIGDTVAGWRLDQIREDRVVIAGGARGMREVLLRESGKPRPAHTVGHGSADAQWIESVSPPARPASTPAGNRDAVPRGLGPMPSQLFRPAMAQPTTPEAMPMGQE